MAPAADDGHYLGNTTPGIFERGRSVESSSTQTGEILVPSSSATRCLALLIPSCLLATSLAAQAVPRSNVASCEGATSESDAVCGKLTVWEDRDARSGRTLDLFYMILPATGPNPEPDPIYVLTGGPGSAATGTAGGWIGSEHREHRTIVMMDQRGTGRSNGLKCLFDEDAPVEVYLGQIFDPDHIADCVEDLSKHADLTKYTSPFSLDDVEDLRQALGHDQINLWGTSYGTRASLVYLRRHGTHVRSAVLNGSMSLGQVMPDGMALDAEAALRGVLKDCSEMPDCAAAFPTVQADYRAVVEADWESVGVTIRDPRTDAPVDATMTRAGFAESLRAMMYDPGATRDIPRLLHLAATDGNYDGFGQFGAARAHAIGLLAATGMYLSVTCAEDIPFANEPGEYEQAAGTFLGDARARSHFEACRRWPAGSVDPDFHDAVASEAPVLIINGSHDPVTPPHWGEDAARTLPNALHVTVPHGHHGWGSLENSDCVNRIQAAFLAEPGRHPDVTCLDQVRRRPFNP